MLQKTVIRPCEISDYSALRTFDEFMGDRRIDMQHGNLLVAERQGDVVGYAKVAPTEFLGWPLLSIVCVAAVVRGQGIGGDLIAAVAESPQWLRLYSSTEASNLIMLSLLKKRGAREVGFVDNLNISEEREVLFRLK
ncbi:GNAT family N-acetyltransferase [Tropicimonas sp.]|uniref:GNAT family N-acetyltransferase n=1 Tax=Tropicimonas sp. TaxID=2067044 RepID=UPI003A88EA22